MTRKGPLQCLCVYLPCTLRTQTQVPPVPLCVSPMYTQDPDTGPSSASVCIPHVHSGPRHGSLQCLCVYLPCTLRTQTRVPPVPLCVFPMYTQDPDTGPSSASVCIPHIHSGPRHGSLQCLCVYPPRTLRTQTQVPPVPLCVSPMYTQDPDTGPLQCLCVYPPRTLRTQTRVPPVPLCVSPTYTQDPDTGPIQCLCVYLPCTLRTQTTYPPCWARRVLHFARRTTRERLPSTREP